MTKAERIEAMARAIATLNETLWDFDPKDPDDQYLLIARAAYDAADVEGMVRAGAIEGMLRATGTDGWKREDFDGPYKGEIDAIVGRVCGNE